MTLEELKQSFTKLARPNALEGMARYGINVSTAYGVSIPDLRNIAKDIGKDHSFALKLWSSGIHDARILASMIDDPNKVTERQMNSWVKDFNSWDLCDQCCNNLFWKTSFAWDKAFAWAQREEEFVKRAAFALQAVLAWHEKDTDDSKFLDFLPVIIDASTDSRNYVKKAVNWALRQIGKRSANLWKPTLECCEDLMVIDSKSAKWIARDAKRELESDAVKRRLNIQN
jgi:3-methyladenine DNA glycosylase AlkD